MSENIKDDYIENGVVKISNEVISTIASTAAMEIEGVVDMNSSLAGGISEFLGKKNHGKGVKTQVDGNEVSLELYLNLAYGAKLNQVGQEVQNKVKEAVENMTDLLVKNVDVHIQGVVKTKSQEDEIK